MIGHRSVALELLVALPLSIALSGVVGADGLDAIRAPTRDELPAGWRRERSDYGERLARGNDWIVIWSSRTIVALGDEPGPGWRKVRQFETRTDSSLFRWRDYEGPGKRVRRYCTAVSGLRERFACLESDGSDFAPRSVDFTEIIYRIAAGPSKGPAMELPSLLAHDAPSIFPLPREGNLTLLAHLDAGTLPLIWNAGSSILAYSELVKISKDIRNPPKDESEKTSSVSDPAEPPMPLSTSVSMQNPALRSAALQRVFDAEAKLRDVGKSIRGLHFARGTQKVRSREVESRQSGLIAAYDKWAKEMDGRRVAMVRRPEVSSLDAKHAIIHVWEFGRELKTYVLVMVKWYPANDRFVWSVAALESDAPKAMDALAELLLGREYLTTLEGGRD